MIPAGPDAVAYTDTEEMAAFSTDIDPATTFMRPIDPHGSPFVIRLDMTREAIVGLIVVIVGVVHWVILVSASRHS